MFGHSSRRRKGLPTENREVSYLPIKKAKKRPDRVKNLKQIGCQNREADCRMDSIVQVFHDQPHLVATLAQAERPLDCYAIRVVLILYFLRGFRQIGVRCLSAKSRPGHPYAMLFAVRPVLSRPIDLVDQDPFRVVTDSSAMALDRPPAESRLRCRARTRTSRSWQAHSGKK